MTNRAFPGSVEFMVMWNPDADVGTKMFTGGYEDPETLEVRPYQPKPWFKGPIVKEVVYYDGDDIRGGTEVSEVQLAW